MADRNFSDELYGLIIRNNQARKYMLNCSQTYLFGDLGKYDILFIPEVWVLIIDVRYEE